MTDDNELLSTIEGPPDIEVLRSHLASVEHELADLLRQLGSAVLDADPDRVETIETRLDGLTVRRLGLQAEINALEAAARAGAERERRRQEAAQRERERRELVAAQLELYDAWAVSLEHRARIVELELELERLRNSAPVDSRHLEQLRQRLVGAGVALDQTAGSLENSPDPAALREAARHYQELSSSTREREGPYSNHPFQGERGELFMPSNDQEQTDLTESTTWVADAGSVEPPRPVAPAPQAAASSPSPEPDVGTPPAGETAEAAWEQDEARIEAALRDLGAEESRLRSWRATLESQGDPLGVLGEVRQQLDDIAEKRETLLAYRQRVQTGLDPRRTNRPWLRRLGLG